MRRTTYDLFCIAGYTVLYMRSSKNEFIQPAGHIKISRAEKFYMRRVPGLCKYGHIRIYIPFIIKGNVAVYKDLNRRQNGDAVTSAAIQGGPSTRT